MLCIRHCQYIILKIIHSITLNYRLNDFPPVFLYASNQNSVLCIRVCILFVYVFASFNIIKIISLVVDPFFRFFFIFILTFMSFSVLFLRRLWIYFQFFCFLLYWDLLANIFFDHLVMNQRNRTIPTVICPFFRICYLGFVLSREGNKYVWVFWKPIACQCVDGALLILLFSPGGLMLMA